MPPRPLTLYNTLTRSIEPVRPLHPPKVTLYVCGPTIYNFAHIGNFRSNLAVDLLRRTLHLSGYEVDHVMQFTDVDDKTIRGANSAGLTLRDFTAVYRQAFLEDAETLALELPARMPNATDHIAEMIHLVERLVANGSAYASEDGSVYFRIASFPQYGALTHLDLAGLVPGARVSQDEYEKEGVGDFVLWKKWVAADGPVGWDSPWGRGRPGWHIECSALSMEFLGPEIDIHAGGVDLRFPHHENEIAQSESATHATFVRHWFHVEHLLVDGEKMAKSKNNIFTVRDVLARGYTGRELRYALLSGSHYSKNLNFTWQGMDDARTQLNRIDTWQARLTRRAAEIAQDTPPATPDSDGLAGTFRTAFEKALADDLNLNEALGHLFQLVRECNKQLDAEQLTPPAAQEIVAAWDQFDQVLGVGAPRQGVPSAAQELLDQRAAARQAKDFAASDRLRAELAKLGWKVKDTPAGQELTKA